MPIAATVTRVLSVLRCATEGSGTSIVLALFAALAAWAVRGLGSVWLALLCLVGAIALAVGAASGLDLHPGTDAPVAVFALTGGCLLGRLVPARARPMLALLVLLAALDAVQLVAPGPASGPASPTAHPAWYWYGMFALDGPWGHTVLGVFDLLLVAALATHAERRGLPLLVAAAPGVLAFVLADVMVFAAGAGNLPLVPFLLGGWLLSEAALRLGPGERLLARSRRR